MGWNIPIYAHIPLIHGMDGRNYPKDTSSGINTYKEMGYLTEEC